MGRYSNAERYIKDLKLQYERNRHNTNQHPGKPEIFGNGEIDTHNLSIPFENKTVNKLLNRQIVKNGAAFIGHHKETIFDEDKAALKTHALTIMKETNLHH